MNKEDTNEAQTFSESTALETENLPLEVPSYTDAEPFEPIQPIEADPIDELLSSPPITETGDDLETVAALRAENESLKNTVQILSERYDNKCQEFDKLMKSYIRVRQQLGLDPPQPRPPLGGLPQPAPEYRKRINSDYWN